MKILQKANSVYAKHLYIIVPAITILIGVLEFIFGGTTSLKMTSCLVIAGASGLFAYMYIKGGKKNITLFLAQIYELYYILFLFIARVTNMNDFFWMIFICISLFGLFFILTVNMTVRPKK